MHIISDEEMEQLIEDYVDRETAVARKPVDDATTAIKQELDEI